MTVGDWEKMSKPELITLLAAVCRQLETCRRKNELLGKVLDERKARAT